MIVPGGPLALARAAAQLPDGVHPRVVQERLGHSNIAITLQTYSHVRPTMHDAAAAMVAYTFMPQLGVPSGDAA